MAGKIPVPTKPELIRHNNGIRVIRYPFQTRTGGTVARTFKLTGIEKEECLRLFGVFREHWGKMNGKGPESVLAAMDVAMGKKPKGTALKVQTAEDQAKAERLEKQRVYQREHYRNKKLAKAGVPQASDLDSVVDLIGVIVSSLGAISTSMKMLQDKITSMQQKR